VGWVVFRSQVCAGWTASWLVIFGGTRLSFVLKRIIDAVTDVLRVDLSCVPRHRRFIAVGRVFTGRLVLAALVLDDPVVLLRHDVLLIPDPTISARGGFQAQVPRLDMHTSFFFRSAGREASEGIVGCDELDRKARSTGYRIVSDKPAIFAHKVTLCRQLPRMIMTAHHWQTRQVMMSSSHLTTPSDQPAVIAGNSGRPIRVL
jgi:hypothetical protein